MKVRELVTVWGFDIDQKPLDKMEARVSDLKSELKHVGLVAVGAAASLFGLAKTYADAGEQAKATAELLGFGTEEFQLWQRAAENAEVPTEVFNLALRNMKSNAAEAGEAGSQVGKVFRKLGVQTRDANGEVRNSSELLLDLAAAFQRIPKNAQGRLAEQIFGARSQKFLLFLRQGPEGIRKALAEGRGLQFAITDEDAKAADDFNDSLHDTILVVKSLRNVMGRDLLPVIGEMLSDFRDWVGENRDVIKSNLVGFVRGLVAGFKAAAPIALALLTTIGAIIQGLGGAERVTKAFVAGWALFKGFQIVSILGSIVTQSILAAKSMTFLGKSAMLAQLRIFGVVLLAAALIEDVVGFFQGRDSVLGRIVDSIKSIFSDLAELAKVLLRVVDKYTMIGRITSLVTGGRSSRAIESIGGSAVLRGGVPVRPDVVGEMAAFNRAAVVPRQISIDKANISVEVKGGNTNEETGAVVAAASRAAIEDVLRDAERDHPDNVER